MITVFGTSDDLVEVEGDISEEFNAYSRTSDESWVLAFSSGDVLRIQYTDTGVWRIAPVVATHRLAVAQASEGDQENYSDVADISGDVEWVVFGSAVARARSL